MTPTFALKRKKVQYIVLKRTTKNLVVYSKTDYLGSKSSYLTKKDTEKRCYWKPIILNTDLLSNTRKASEEKPTQKPR